MTDLTPTQTDPRDLVTHPCFIEYDHRSDGGPHRVGPFPSRTAANTHAEAKVGPGFTASWSIVSLTDPTDDIHPVRGT